MNPSRSHECIHLMLRKQFLKFLIGGLQFAFLSSSHAQYTKLFDFDSAGVVNGSGCVPESDFTGDSTYLYATARSGGTNNMGTIFKIKPDGTGFARLLDFDGITNGNSPVGHFISDGTYFYGMAGGGGTNGCGTIFKIKPDGTGFVKLFDFDGVTNGRNPSGSFISDGTFLYGMTMYGGTISNNCPSGCGTIFKIKPDGTGYYKIFNFMGSNGAVPGGSLIYDGNFFYGMSATGDSNNIGNHGNIFKIRPDGTGFSILLSFNGTNGSNPLGSLISDGTCFYGMTRGGGINNMGTIFKIKPDGTGFSVLLSFNGTNGSSPWGSLISDGTCFYGMTGGGGTNNMGTIFKIKPDGTGYAKMFDFDYTPTGAMPSGSLISDGTFLYGMTMFGGTNGVGTVFKYQDSTTTGIPTSNAEKDIVIYPNPSNEYIQYHIESKQGGTVLLEVFDVLGRKVISKEEMIDGGATENRSNTATLSSGIYLLRITTPTQEKTQKQFVIK